MNATRISCILPIHNEEALLATVISDLIANFEKQGYLFEIILVENGSSDGSKNIINQWSKKDRRIKGYSLPVADYGRALKYGYLHSTYPIAVNFSADWIDMAFLTRGLQFLTSQDIVIASKNIKGSRDQRSWERKIGGRLFHALVKIGFGLPVSDTHGIKVIKLATVRDTLQCCKITGELFDTEFLIRAHRKNLLIKEIPTDVTEKRASRIAFSKRAIKSIYQFLYLRYMLWQENLQ